MRPVVGRRVRGCSVEPLWVVRAAGPTASGPPDVFGDTTVRNLDSLLCLLVTERLQDLSLGSFTRGPHTEDHTHNERHEKRWWEDPKRCAEIE